MTNEKKGIIYAVLSSICLGLAGITDKLGTVASKKPFLYSSETILFALFFTTIYFFFYSHSKKITYKNPGKISWIQIIIIGCFASGIVILLRFVGLVQSTGSFASLSQIITTTITIFLANIFLKEKFSKIFWFLFLIILVSIYFVSVGKFELVTIKRGDIFILSATLFLATANIISRIAVKKVNPIFLGVGRFFFGFIFLLLVNLLILSFSHETITFTFYAILSGLFWMGNVILFNVAISYVGATLTTSLLMLAPIVTLFIEATALSYKFTPLQYIASIVVVICGIIITLKR